MLGGKCAASIMVLYNFDPDLSEILNSISRRSLDYAIFVDNSDKKLISNKFTPCLNLILVYFISRILKTLG